MVFSHLDFWSGNLFLIAPFPDLCLLVPFNDDSSCYIKANVRNHTGGIDENEIDKALSFYKQGKDLMLESHHSPFSATRAVIF